MTDAQRDKRLREILSVPREATLLDILKLVAAEGWTPHPYRDDVEGETLFFGSSRDSGEGTRVLRQHS